MSANVNDLAREIHNSKRQLMEVKAAAIKARSMLMEIMPFGAPLVLAALEELNKVLPPYVEPE